MKRRHICTLNIRDEAAASVRACMVASMRSPSSGGSGRVYFIQCGGDDGPVKIGFTRDLHRRLTDLQIANPYPLRVVLELPGADELYEFALHRHFAAACLRGEWFAFTPELRAWIDTVRGRLQSEAA